MPSVCLKLNCLVTLSPAASLDASITDSLGKTMVSPGDHSYSIQTRGVNLWYGDFQALRD